MFVFRMKCDVAIAATCCFWIWSLLVDVLISRAVAMILVEYPPNFADANFSTWVASSSIYTRVFLCICYSHHDCGSPLLDMSYRPSFEDPI